MSKLINLDFVLLSSLSVLGIIYILQQIVDGLYSNYTDTRPTIVIMVKNHQNQIEGIVRSYYESTKNPKDLWIIDNGSKDQTRRILDKISKKYPGIKTIFWSDDSRNLCFRTLISKVKNPAILFIDATNLKYNEILNLTNIK